MYRLLLLCLTVMFSLQTFAQGTVKGHVVDKATDESLQFVNAAVYAQNDTTKIVAGAITDANGSFTIGGLKNGRYRLVLSFVGYRDVVRQFNITAQKPNEHFSHIFMSEDSRQLSEVTVVGQRSGVKLEVDRKSFDVSQDISNAGGAASDVLENIPSVEVDQDGNVSLRGNTSVEVWINGKASGLTSDNRAEILKQLPAESIERIEVIDNPSAKFSAEGSAGIINIVLKRDRKAGYYGSVRVGGNTNKSANTGFSINYSSGLLDAYANIGYRHRQNNLGGSLSEQQYLNTNQYQNYRSDNSEYGNNLFSRAGLTFHPTTKDDIGVSGMMMFGGRKSYSHTPYHYGTIGAMQDTYLMHRDTRSGGDNRMLHGELSYRHMFTDTHFIDLTLSTGNWRADNHNISQDSPYYYSGEVPTAYSWQSRPMNMRNRNSEIKLDYENPITDKMRLQAGYNGRFSHENSPQESFIADKWAGGTPTEEKTYFNRFIYDNTIHALYATATYNFGKFGLMGGLRGEYWKVNTESYDWEQEHNPQKRDKPFKKDFFELFPSIFMSYQLTDNDQLQLNWTRRLRRPWGGQLNNFKNTRDASMVSFGNPELTPEFSNSFSLNYLKTFGDQSFLLSAYYRPTTDVIQRIRWQSMSDGLMYSTSMNLSKSTSTGLELTLKNRLFKILDINTNANFYYYKLNGFSYVIEGQTVTGEEDHNFTWNARCQASLILPYDISVQVTGNYRARQVITQGYRKASYGMDMGLRKNFFDKKLTVSLNCRDLLDSRHWENYTSGPTFTRHQKNWRGGRRFNLTLSWNFGNMKPKREERGDEDADGGEGGGAFGQDNFGNNQQRGAANAQQQKGGNNNPPRETNTEQPAEE